VIPIKDNIPSDRMPVVTLGLIAINVVAYLLTVVHGGSLLGGPSAAELAKYGAIPYQLTNAGAHTGLRETIPAWETVFTSMFVHASIIQFAGNMLFLWIFGNTIEDSLGHLRFIGFYLLSGIVAMGLQVAAEPNSISPTIGAAGAIGGVLGGYTLLYLRARVLTFTFIILFFTVIEVPVAWMLGIWFGLQALFVAAGLTNPAPGSAWIAYFAGLGSFAFGAATVRLVATSRKPIPPPRPVY
jgi:membrane associated rhomboid family serine protease